MSRNSNFWFNHSSSIPSKVDVVIIGGGITGLFTLINLLRRDPSLSVVLLEEENGVGEKASGRASGQLTLTGGRLFSEMEDEDAQKYISFLEHSLSSIKYLIKKINIDCDLVECGGLHLSTSNNQSNILLKEYDKLNNHLNQSEVIKLRKDELRSLTSSDIFEKGFLSSCEAKLNPYKFVCGLAKATEPIGDRILTNCQVEAVTKFSSGYKVQVRRKGIISAEKVVYCMNAYSEDLLPELSGFFTPFRGQIILTKPLKKQYLDKLHDISMTINGCREYIRLCDDRLLIGGLRGIMKGMQEGITFDGQYSTKIYNSLRKRLFEIFPFIEECSIEKTWTGIMCKTYDGLPLVGPRPGYENQWIAAGFNGYGISHFLSGDMIAKYVFGDKDNYSVDELFDPNRIYEVGNEIEIS